MALAGKELKDDLISFKYQNLLSWPKNYIFLFKSEKMGMIFHVNSYTDDSHECQTLF